MNNQNKYVTKVCNSYATPKTTKIDELRKLDKKVKLFPSVFAYIFGTVASLILGTGMCFAMEVIGASLMSYTAMMTVGVVIGCVGIILCVANYFIYKKILNMRKRKYGNQIIALGNEILNSAN